MIALLQRVKRANVIVNSEIVGKIGPGLLIFIGVFKGDTYSDAKFLAGKCAHIRIFENISGKMDKSLLETQGSVLIISQFTLCANTEKGRRPSFIGAANPDEAEEIYNVFIQKFSQYEINIATGVFGEIMKVNLTNDGPVTLILNSNAKKN